MIPKALAMMTWLVSWAADVIFTYKMQSTGRTSNERVTGHRCDQPVIGFAEKINFKFTTDKNHRNNMSTEWSTGFFVGINGKTTEYLVATEEGIFSCATIRRLPDDEAYERRCLEFVSFTYRDFILEFPRSSPLGVRFGETHSKNAESDPMTAPIVPRRARLKPEDFQKSATQSVVQDVISFKSEDQSGGITMTHVVIELKQN